MTNPHGSSPAWYDHSLLAGPGGEHEFKLSVTWVSTTAFPPLPLPAGVPTSEKFKVTITSVCQLEDMIVPNAALPITSVVSKIN